MPLSRLSYRYGSNVEGHSFPDWCASYNTAFLVLGHRWCKCAASPLVSVIPPCILPCQPLSVASSDWSELEYRCPSDNRFTLSELNGCFLKLKNCKNYPVPDDVTNHILKNLSGGAKPWLLAPVNYVWETGDISETWKTAWIDPIFHPGKPTSRLKSYLPMSLL